MAETNINIERAEERLVLLRKQCVEARNALGRDDIDQAKRYLDNAGMVYFTIYSEADNYELSEEEIKQLKVLRASATESYELAQALVNEKA